MQTSDPVRYTNISPDQFEFFKNMAKGKGASINGNKDNVTLDLIPIGVEYDPQTKVLILCAQEPFWVTPGAVTGALHKMVAQAMATDPDALKTEPVKPAPVSTVDKSPAGNRLPEAAPKKEYATR